MVRLVVVIHLPSQQQRNVGCMTSDMRVTGSVGVPLWQASRFDTVQKIANVERRRITTDFGDCSAGQQCGRTQDEFAAVASFDPARFPFKPNGA
jgi:hypothetical protein